MNDKHEWHEFNEGRVKTDAANNEFISLTIESANTKKWPIIYRALIGESDAIAIAKHFKLIPNNEIPNEPVDFGLAEIKVEGLPTFETQADYEAYIKINKLELS